MTTCVSLIDQANLLFQANSAFLQPFSSPRPGSLIEASSIWHKKFYWSLENENGDEFIKTMRRFHISYYNLDPAQVGMRTWADWTFNNHPVIYEVIIKCKLLILQSLLKSEEGPTLLNQSYPLPGYEYIGPDEFLIVPKSEFPIHTALRLCYAWEKHEKELGPPKIGKRSVDEFPPCYANAFLILQELVAHQAQLNQEDCDGRTPLYFAAKANQSALGDFLLEYGALSIKMDCNTASLQETELLFLLERYQILRQKIAKIMLTITLLPKVLILLTTDYV